ncbi:relaxase/mobilization nuclease domain-containing protein [Propionibacterium freudenreichii]|uniref:relaxase/mobilization nuclease domain-containing protein n=1 Tax=Propionibacterium freudenreichii TaxID=1744 RepID=UPI00254B3FCA|nr:relaxase/mobilization nuclease domain-containing protein [Propionibacterium freudenreichii]MDK9661424.1 relaxase/mobilization nuclease domain-containing protein [Propionibacterium freudenreichii]
MGVEGERAAAMACDTPGGPAAFAARARAVAERHGREVEALHYRQSFALEELSPTDPDDIQRANDLGYELAHRMHPDADAVVVTHVDGRGSDGRGGKVHNHIIVANHHNASGKALTDYRSFLDRPDKGRTVTGMDGQAHRVHQHGIQSANDALMVEHGMSVVDRLRTTPKDWELRREAFSPDSLDRQAGDRFQAALEDKRSVDRDHLEEVLDDQWLNLTKRARHAAEEKHADPQPVPRIELRSTVSRKAGTEMWTLYIEELDHIETKRRWHRKRCTAMSEDFTPEGARLFFNYHSKQLQQEQDRIDHERSTRQAEGQGHGLIAVAVDTDEPGRDRRGERPDHGSQRDADLGRRSGPGRHPHRGPRGARDHADTFADGRPGDQ